MTEIQGSLPDRMGAMVLTGHGGLDRLVWREDLPVPRPAPGEVVIRVGATAVNNTDINTRIGWYSKSVRGDTASGADKGYGAAAEADGGWSGAIDFPRIQGADCCGEIVATGEGVPASRLGERVLVRALQSRIGPDGMARTLTYGSERDGGFAEYTSVAVEDALAVRSDLTDLELASFPCAFSTAEGMIQRAGLGPEHVLVTGASGGVGSAAIQLAKRRGAHVTAMTGDEKAGALHDLGADATCARDARLPDEAFDVVLDLVGGPRWGDLIAALKTGGRYVTAGAIAGPIVELDLRTLYLRDLTLLGSTYQPANVFSDLVRYIEAGELRPVISQTFGLHEMHAAQEAFLTKAHVGKIAITVGH